MKLTQKLIKRYIIYNPVTGLMKWRITKNQYVRGKVLGGFDKDGYIIVSFLTGRYKAHRLAWLYMTGENPKYDIHHKNGIVDDNRWDNLEHLSRQEHFKHNPKPSNNTSGVKGVVFDKSRNKWAARIGHNNKLINLGRFSTKVCAVFERYYKEFELCYPEDTSAYEYIYNYLIEIKPLSQ